MCVCSPALFSLWWSSVCSSFLFVANIFTSYLSSFYHLLSNTFFTSPFSTSLLLSVSTALKTHRNGKSSLIFVCFFFSFSSVDKFFFLITKLLLIFSHIRLLFLFSSSQYHGNLSNFTYRLQIKSTLLTLPKLDDHHHLATSTISKLNTHLGRS